MNPAQQQVICVACLVNPPSLKLRTDRCREWQWQRLTSTKDRAIILARFLVRSQKEKGMDTHSLRVRFFNKEEVIKQNVVESVIEEGSYKVWEDTSPFGYHSNFPCPICRQRPALFNNSQGTMTPCSNCRLRGYHTLRLKTNNRFVRWLMDKIMTSDSVSVISNTAQIDNTR